MSVAEEVGLAIDASEPSVLSSHVTGTSAMDVDRDAAVAGEDDDDDDPKKQVLADRRGSGQRQAQQQRQCPIHHLKTIDWHDVRVKIVTQNENGPCPLVAICNVLLLNGKLKLPRDSDVVYSSELVDMVGNLILESYPEDLQGPERLDLEQNISDAIAVLPKLITGLDVNVRFTGVRDFEYTAECIIFDLLRIPLYHGWLVEPNAPEVDVVGTNSYNQLVEKIIQGKASEDVDEVSSALAAEGFLERSSWQLTYHGLCELNAAMKEGELAVFFRNNHFSTIYRRKGQLMYLVTDLGFLNEGGVVWAALSSIEGDCVFLDGKFNVSTFGTAAGAGSSTASGTAKKKPVTTPLSPNTKEQVDADFLLAVSIQQMEETKGKEEDEEFLAQKSYLGLTPDASDEEIARRFQEAEDEWVKDQQEEYRRSQQPQSRGGRQGGGPAAAQRQQQQLALGDDGGGGGRRRQDRAARGGDLPSPQAGRHNQIVSRSPPRSHKMSCSIL